LDGGGRLQCLQSALNATKSLLMLLRAGQEAAMERLAGNVAVITGGSGGIALAPRHYFAERAPQLPLLVTSRRRSIRQFTRLATAYEVLCRTLGSQAGWTLAAHPRHESRLNEQPTQTFSAGSPCRIFQTQ
jgi:hypothetical protein